MTIHLAFFIKDEHKVGVYYAILSITSLLFLLGSYFTLTLQDTVLIHAPNDDSLIMPWWGWTITTIISLAIFSQAAKRSIAGVDKVISDDRETRLNDKIDHEFPLTSSTQLLVEKNKNLTDQVNFLFVIIMLFFGWSFVILPFILVGGVVFIVGQFVPYIVIEGSWDWASIIASLSIWFVGMIITAGFWGLYHNTKDIEILTNRLSQLNLTELLEDEEN